MTANPIQQAEEIPQCRAIPECSYSVTKPTRLTVEFRDQGLHWQAQKFLTTDDTDERVYAIHAYFDDRPVFNGTVYIRLFVVATANSVKILRQSTYCQLWIDSKNSPLTVQGIVTCTDGKRRITAKGKVFHNFILSCQVPQNVMADNLKITHMSFAPKPCQNSTVYIPVTYPAKPKKWDHVFGMCEANGVSFGYFEPEQALWLIEWFETNQLFGITEFNIYNATMQVSPPVEKVFDYYQKKGLLMMHQQHLPITGYTSADVAVADIGMRTALNDCMYRNMYRYNYAVTIDIDEIIVPQIHKNYWQMLDSRLPNDSWTSSLTFPSSVYFSTFTGAEDESQNSTYPLKSSRYTYSVADRLRPKTFFNPRLCLGAFSHYCLNKVPGSKDQHHYTGGKLAKVHHYRTRCLKQPGRYSQEVCESLRQVKHFTGRMLDFQTDIFKRFISVVEYLKLKYLL